MSDAQSKTHVTVHGCQIERAESFPSKEQFVALAMKYGKCNSDHIGAAVNLITPTSAPPAVIAPKNNGTAVSVDVDAYQSPVATSSIKQNLSSATQPMVPQGSMVNLQSMHPQVQSSELSNNFGNTNN